jgi:hypothetical protein
VAGGERGAAVELELRLHLGDKGCREECGSWKIIAMSSPRTCLMRSGPALARSSPSNRISPEMRALGARVRPRIVRFATVLRLPDSPTIPSVLPGSAAKDTPSTALTRPSSVSEAVLRLEVDAQIPHLQQGAAGGAHS